MILIVGGMAQGKTEFAKSFNNLKVIDDLHLYIKDRVYAGKSEDEILSEIMAMDIDNAVIIANEVGCGIVPIEKNERDYREICGRILIRLAKKASHVYRMVLGFAEEVK